MSSKGCPYDCSHAFCSAARVTTSEVQDLINHYVLDAYSDPNNTKSLAELIEDAYGMAFKAAEDSWSRGGK